MEKTTIAIPMIVKEQIQEFGIKGETYSDIMVRLLESAKKRLIQDILMDEKDTISIEEALEDAKKRWRK